MYHKLDVFPGAISYFNRSSLPGPVLTESLHRLLGSRKRAQNLATGPGGCACTTGSLGLSSWSFNHCLRSLISCWNRSFSSGVYPVIACFGTFDLGEATMTLWRTFTQQTSASTKKTNVTNEGKPLCAIYWSGRH